MKIGLGDDADTDPAVFEGDDMVVVYGDALLWLARQAQRETGTGASDLTLDAVNRERALAQSRAE